MSKLNKEFKNEFDDEFRKGTYATRKTGLVAVLIIMALIAIFGIGNVIYTKTIGLEQKNAEREVFKKSVAYNEAAASFLAKEYNEYSKAETEADKKTIMQYVIIRYPNLDVDGIDNMSLKTFYTKCMNY